MARRRAARRRSRATETPPETWECGIGVGSQASYLPRTDEVQGIEMGRRMPSSRRRITIRYCAERTRLRRWGGRPEPPTFAPEEIF